MLKQHTKISDATIFFLVLQIMDVKKKNIYIYIEFIPDMKTTG